MAELNEGQANFLEWLKTATPEEVRELMPFIKGNAETAAIQANENEQLKDLSNAAMQLKTEALEQLTKKATKDSGKNVTDQSLLTKLLLKNNDTGVVTLGKSEGIVKQARAQIENNGISLIEYNILRSIFSYQLDSGVDRGGEINFSASQLYRKMRRGKGSGKVNKSQQEEIHAAMMALDRRITYWLNDPAQEWLNVNNGRLKHQKLLHFDYDEGIVNGQRTEYYYTVYNVGLLQEIAYRAGQIERIPQEILAIEKFDGEKWKHWTLSNKRIEIRTILELFIFQLIRTNTIISNKKPYADIFDACNIGNHRETQRRAKEDIATILDYWQHLGLFASWNEYGNGRGIEINVIYGELE